MATQTDNNSVASISALTKGRTFWLNDKVKVASYAPAFTAGTSSTYASGATWVACKSSNIATAADCNGGVGYNNAATTKDQHMSKRIFWVAGSDAALSPGGTSVTYTWNHDILTASLYQSSGAALLVDGSVWCTSFRNVLSSTSVINPSVGFGLSGSSKCTFMLVAGVKTEAPVVKLVSADFANWIFQWVEFATTAGLGANGVLSSDDTSNYKIGAYDDNLGPYINPAKSVPTVDTAAKWTGFTITYQFEEKTTAAWRSGSLGTAVYYAENPKTPWANTVLEIDSAILLDTYAEYKSYFAAYNAKVAVYNPKRIAYDTAVDTETKRRADFFAASMTPSVAIPERPCPPDQPKPMPSPSLDLSQKTWDTNPTTQKLVASLKRGTANTPDPSYHTRLGYYTALYDLSDLTKVSYTGKVFGRLGQGTGNMPATSTPFYWAESTSTLADANGAHMMISVFPDSKDATGLVDSAKKIIFEAKAMTLEDNATYKLLTTPTAAISPKPGLAGASMLAAGLISGAAAMVSLF